MVKFTAKSREPITTNCCCNRSFTKCSKENRTPLQAHQNFKVIYKMDAL